MVLPLCLINDIDEGDARGFNLNGSAIIAIKKQGELYLYQNSCPHRGINLEWQPDKFLDADRQLIQCATHGALFLIDSGQCVQGPCLGEHLQAIEFSIDGDQVLVEIPEAPPSPDQQASAC
ncbi:MAG: Rieske 2Fe-2S domain-containing protein [Motiliproteus sp.]